MNTVINEYTKDIIYIFSDKDYFDYIEKTIGKEFADDIKNIYDDLKSQVNELKRDVIYYRSMLDDDDYNYYNNYEGGI